jgi:hypothetical protein
MIKNIFFPNCKIKIFIVFLLSLFAINSACYAHGDSARGDSAREDNKKIYNKNNFYIEPALSIEYNAPRVSGSGNNKHFATTEHIFKQLYNLENIAIGAHIRFHDNFGFNANWVQTSLDSTALKDAQPLAKKALYKIDHYNFSLLTYAPIIKNFFEIFGELGLADMRANLSYVDINGKSVRSNSHQTRFFYSAGLQVSVNDINTIRFSAQRYVGKVGLINSDYTTVRIGFLRFF